jgi:transporter family-2 protein
MSNSIFVLLTLVVGFCFPVMAYSNAVLGKSLGSPFTGTLAVFMLGSSILLFIIWFTKAGVPTIGQIKQIDWRVWLGGCIVILNLITYTIVPARIGMANMIVLLIAGQLIASVGAEHFGLLRFPVHLINWQRILGVVLLVAGVVLVKKF